MDLAAAAAADFTPHVGDPFRLADGLQLVLHSVEEKPGPGTRFSLTFHGPTDPLLPQATYRLEHEALGGFALFIVPVHSTGEAFVYEAVFNRV